MRKAQESVPFILVTYLFQVFPSLPRLCICNSNTKHIPFLLYIIISDRPYFCRVEPDIFETLYGISKKKFNKEACGYPVFLLNLLGFLGLGSDTNHIYIYIHYHYFIFVDPKFSSLEFPCLQLLYRCNQICLWPSITRVG